MILGARTEWPTATFEKDRWKIVIHVPVVRLSKTGTAVPWQVLPAILAKAT